MSEKIYTSTVTNRAARPRSKRLRELGGKRGCRRQRDGG